MLIIPIKEGENIERALKKYKKKYEKTNVMKQLRSRKEFEKPSVVRRQEIIRAAYKQRMQSQQS
jgi:small subunit ribosomal protein S21